MAEFSDLDQLDSWASMSDEELSQSCSPEAIELLKRAAGELGRESEFIDVAASDHFILQVREVWSLKQKGARELGAVLVEAARLKDLGELGGAEQVYLQFLDTCRAPFYRAIATNELARLRRQ